MIKWSPIIIATIALAGPLAAQTSGDRFTTIDVFQLERTVDPQISPSSDQIVYVRNRRL